MVSLEKFCRLLDVLIYGAALFVIQHYFVEGGVAFGNKAYWLFSGVISLICGSRLISPYFTSPRDASINTLLAFIGAVFVVSQVPTGSLLGFFACALAAFYLVGFVSSFFIQLLDEGTLNSGVWGSSLKSLVTAVGKPDLVFTLLVSLILFAFHMDSASEVFLILSSVFVINRFDFTIQLAKWSSFFAGHREKVRQNKIIIGEIERYNEPDLVTVRQTTKKNYDAGHIFLVNQPSEGWVQGRLLGRAGRDHDYLLRLRIEPLSNIQKDNVSSVKVSRDKPIVMDYWHDCQPEEKIKVGAGRVLPNTNLDFANFELLADANVAEGDLISVEIKGEEVIYQIVDGQLRETTVTEKNTLGFVDVKARKIGKWEDDKFRPVKWLPRPNSEVGPFEDITREKKGESVGHFPGTNLGVSVDVNEMVTHNTAILGILGIGKTFLAFELMERMMAKKIHVVCLDLTDQHHINLEEYYDEGFHRDLVEKLKAAGEETKHVVNKSITKGGSYPEFQKEVRRQLETFLEQNNLHLLVINPADFVVTLQDRGEFNGEAGFADLTASQIAAIFSTELLNLCQEKGITEKARACLVLEEAHSLVPEWNSAGSNFDAKASNRSARAILQGRKYGFGCLLITQRTANVTKSILNQCNTIFAMRTFDDTGKDFLANYIGKDYTEVLSTLQERHAVVYGKASSCDNPVMVRLNDREDFRKLNPPLKSAPTIIVDKSGSASAETDPKSQATDDSDKNDI